MARKKWLMIIIVVVLGLLSAGFIDKSFLEKKFAQSLINKEEELDNRFLQEKVKEERNLEERYQADIVSRLAMEKRIERQREKIREFESQLHFK